MPTYQKTLSTNLQDADRTAVREYFTTAEAAYITGFSVKSLETMRARGQGPAFFKVGRSVRYRVADLVTWIENGGQK